MRAKLGLKVSEIDAAVGGLGYFPHLIADKGGGGGIGAVGGGGNQNGGATGVAARLMRRLDRQDAAQFAMGARLGAQRHGRHAGQGLQPVGELVHQRQSPLDGGNGLQGVDVGEARQARHLLVEARIMLHGARAERIQGQVNGVIGLGQAHIVTHRLWLGQTGQTYLALAHQILQIILGIVGRKVRQIDAGLVVVVIVEDQSFGLKKPLAPGQGGGKDFSGGAKRFGPGRATDRCHVHAQSAFFKAVIRVSMSLSSVVSVAASKSTSSKP